MATSEEERRSLEEQLSKELQDFIASRKATPYTDGWNEDNWEKEMQQHPMFMTQEVVNTGELPPLVEALQQLKYDPAENTAEELAENYKQDGNENFRLKKYRWAVDSYTTGLQQKSSNANLNATLYTNRAASHYRIGNFRTALIDAQSALKLEPSHFKALVRGALCCKQLERYAECLEWCTIALKLDPDNKILLETKVEVTKLQRIHERDLRKQQALEKQEKHVKGRLKDVLQERGVKVSLPMPDNVEESEVVEDAVAHPALGNVHLDEHGSLVWPVIFLYPEHGQTDFIQNFHEDSLFESHLMVMLGNEGYPDWDEEKKYIAERIQIYFEDTDQNMLVPVSSNQSLREVLSHPRYKVFRGWPMFQLLVKDSLFEAEWKTRFKNSNS